MRISVLTGLFACSVIIAVSSPSADASAQSNLETTSPSSTTILSLDTVSETTKSPLLSIIEDSSVNEVAEIVPEVPVVKKHVVAENETLSKIAESYETTWTRLYDKNIQIENPNVISEGQEVVIPETTEVIEPRVVVAPEPESNPVLNSRSTSEASKTAKQSVNSSRASAPASSDGNRYVAGYCTWYVKNRRPDLPNNLGNAITWVSRAASQGFATGSTPRVGAVGQQGNHVAYVESVNGDGTVTVSDMNWTGLYQMTTRTVPASNFSYIY